MVRHHPRRLPGGHARDRLAQLGGVPARVQQLEGEGVVQVLEVGPEVRGRQVHLAHQQGVAGGLADGGERGADVRRVARVDAATAPRGPRAPAGRRARWPAGRRAARGPSSAGRWRPPGSRPPRGRARSGSPPAWRPPRPGCASPGRPARGRRSAGTSARRAGSRPGRRRPSASCSARRPTRRSPGRSVNHGCSIEVWQGTRSMSTFSPRSCAAATSASRSPSVPSDGSTAR